MFQKTCRSFGRENDDIVAGQVTHLKCLIHIKNRLETKHIFTLNNLHTKNLHLCSVSSLPLFRPPYWMTWINRHGGKKTKCI